MKRETLKTIWQMGWKITLGCAIFALGFDLFLEPNSLNVGGMSGLAMVLRELLGFGQIGVITMLLNVPLFILGARKLGRKFLFGSLAGMLLSSVFIDLFSVIPAPKTEILLDSLYGGILVGLGIGLVFLSGATTGGSDIAAKLLRRRFRSASLGKVMLAIDLFIITLTGIVFHDLSKTLYSALPLAASSFVMDQLLYGLDHSTVALIISEQYQAVSKQIADRLDRGATVLEGSGSYTGSPRPVLMSAVRQKELPEIKAIVVEKPGLDVACGAIGIGEITSIPTAPAIADAYYRYDGKFRTSLPLEGTPYSRK